MRLEEEIVASSRRKEKTKAISLILQLATRDRIVRHAAKIVPEKVEQIRVRFRGLYCYIDAEESGAEEPLHLCRLCYTGKGNAWTLAFYTYSHEKYEPSSFATGSVYGSPEEGLEIGAIYLR
jgi:hypothetical protein